MIFSSLFSAEGSFPDWVIWVILGVVLLAMFIVPMFTRRKQQGQVNEMLNNIAPGDRIKTVGGIIGTIVRVEQKSATEKEFVIETGDEVKTQIRLDIQAIYQVVSKANVPASESEGLISDEGEGKKTEVFEETRTEETTRKDETPKTEDATEEKSVDEVETVKKTTKKTNKE